MYLYIKWNYNQSIEDNLHTVATSIFDIFNKPIIYEDDSTEYEVCYTGIVHIHQLIDIQSNISLLHTDNYNMLEQIFMQITSDCTSTDYIHSHGDMLIHKKTKYHKHKMVLKRDIVVNDVIINLLSSTFSAATIIIDCSNVLQLQHQLHSIDKLININSILLYQQGKMIDLRYISRKYYELSTENRRIYNGLHTKSQLLSQAIVEYIENNELRAIDRKSHLYALYRSLKNESCCNYSDLSFTFMARTPPVHYDTKYCKHIDNDVVFIIGRGYLDELSICNSNNYIYVLIPHLY